MVTAEDKPTSDVVNEQVGHPELEEDGIEEEEEEGFENPYHNPNMNGGMISDSESENETDPAPNGWVTFTNDNDTDSEFGDFNSFASLSAENGEESENEEKSVVDFTTTGFLKQKFTQDHIDLIKECMRSIKLSNVPEWVNRIGPNNAQLNALKREVNPQPLEFPEK